MGERQQNGAGVAVGMPRVEGLGDTHHPIRLHLFHGVLDPIARILHALLVFLARGKDECFACAAIPPHGMPASAMS